MAQHNMQMYSGHGPKLIYSVTVSHHPPHPTISHTEKSIRCIHLSFGAFCVKGTRTVNSLVKYKVQKQWDKCYVGFALWIPLQNRHYCWPVWIKGAQTSCIHQTGHRKAMFFRAATHTGPSWVTWFVLQPSWLSHENQLVEPPSEAAEADWELTKKINK